MAIRKPLVLINGVMQELPGPDTLLKDMVGLSNVDDTSDMSKPVSNPQADYIATQIANSGGGGNALSPMTEVDWAGPNFSGPNSSTDLGKMWVLSLSSTTAVNSFLLPDATASEGKMLGIRVPPTNPSIIALQANGADLIQGKNKLHVRKNESMVIFAKGGQWYRIWQSLIPIQLHLFPATRQTSAVAINTVTYINFSNAGIGSLYPDIMVGALPAIKIIRPGWYHVEGSVYIGPVSSGTITITEATVGIEVNGILNGAANGRGVSFRDMIDVPATDHRRYIVNTKVYFYENDTVKLFIKLATTAATRPIWAAADFLANSGDGVEATSLRITEIPAF